MTVCVGACVRAFRWLRSSHSSPISCAPPGTQSTSPGLPAGCARDPRPLNDLSSLTFQLGSAPSAVASVGPQLLFYSPLPSSCSSFLFLCLDPYNGSMLGMLICICIRRAFCEEKYSFDPHYSCCHPTCSEDATFSKEILRVGGLPLKLSRCLYRSFPEVEDCFIITCMFLGNIDTLFIVFSCVLLDYFPLVNR